MQERNDGMNDKTDSPSELANAMLDAANDYMITHGPADVSVIMVARKLVAEQMAGVIENLIQELPTHRRIALMNHATAKATLAHALDNASKLGIPFPAENFLTPQEVQKLDEATAKRHLTDLFAIAEATNERNVTEPDTDHRTDLQASNN